MSKPKKRIVTRDELRFARQRCYAKLADDASRDEQHVIRCEFEGRVRDAVRTGIVAIQGFSDPTMDAIEAAVTRCRTFLDNSAGSADDRDRVTAMQIMHDAICKAIVAELDAEVPKVEDAAKLPNVVRRPPRIRISELGRADAVEDDKPAHEPVQNDNEPPPAPAPARDSTPRVIVEVMDSHEVADANLAQELERALSGRPPDTSVERIHATSPRPDAEPTPAPQNRPPVGPNNSAHAAYNARISEAWKTQPKVPKKPKPKYGFDPSFDPTR